MLYVESIDLYGYEKIIYCLEWHKHAKRPSAQSATQMSVAHKNHT